MQKELEEFIENNRLLNKNIEGETSVVSVWRMSKLDGRIKTPREELLIKLGNALCDNGYARLESIMQQLKELE